MDRDYNILVNTADKLVIQNPPIGIGIIFTIVVICMLSFAVYKLWTNSARRAAIGLIVIMLPINWFVYICNETGYQMEMDRTKNIVVMTTFRGNNPSSFRELGTVRLDNIERVDFESDRSFRRITFLTRDDKSIRPLGSSFELMDSQFKVFKLVQSFIDRGPYQAPNTLDSPR